MLGLESTIPDGRRPAGRTKKLRIERAAAQLELGLGLSLAKTLKNENYHSI